MDNIDNQNWEFLSLLQPYYEELECEQQFNKVNESSIMPKYEEYEAIEVDKWSQVNELKFYEFLKIYKVFTEVEEFEEFTLERAREVLRNLNDNLFMEDHLPKYETQSLIEKFKINIAYQLSKEVSTDLITQWLLVAEEIRHKWKDIDMVALMKSGCSFFMSKNLDKKIENYKMLIILNKFIGKEGLYQERLGNEAFEWLSVDSNIRSLPFAAKFMLDALKNNKFKLLATQKEIFKKIQDELKHWTFHVKRKTKIYRGKIKKWLETGIANNLKIIKSREISKKKIFGDAKSGKADLYTCRYREKKAFIKSYKYMKRNIGNMKSVFNEIANSIYLSVHNRRNTFIKFFGLYLEESEEKNGTEQCYFLNIVMERCLGTLEDYIKEFNCNEVALSNFIDWLFDAFLLLHSYGMAHNDIKPENIFVKKHRGQTILKIADYDISSTISSSHGISLNHSSPFLGATTQFAAPEVRMALENKMEKVRINRMRADVYSLGLVFLYVKSNEWPKKGAIEQEDYIEAKMKEINIPWLKTLLENMIVDDPNKRKKLGELIELKKSLQQKNIIINDFKL